MLLKSSVPRLFFSVLSNKVVLDKFLTLRKTENYYCKLHLFGFSKQQNMFSDFSHESIIGMNGEKEKRISLEERINMSDIQRGVIMEEEAYEKYQTSKEEKGIIVCSIKVTIIVITKGEQDHNHIFKS